MKDTAQLQIFKDFDGYSPKYHFFKNSLFGQIHGSLPWDEFASLLPKEDTGPGAPIWFNAKAMFSLMFLKAYLNVSDRHLIERFNTDYSLQMFCGKFLAEDRQIRDTSILIRVRKYIEGHCEWERIPSVLLDCWKRYVNNSHVLLMDATCYESYFLKIPDCMIAFNTEIHVVIFVFVVLEISMFSQQLVFYHLKPKEIKRKYYLILLSF